MRESGQSGQITNVPHRVSGHPFKNKHKAKIANIKTMQSTGTVVGLLKGLDVRICFDLCLFTFVSATGLFKRATKLFEIFLADKNSCFEVDFCRRFLELC